MTAMLFDIQGGSYVDGPGVRTTVFFKGCHLRCAWCHNPEGISEEPQMLFFKSKCIGCGRCSDICEHKPCILCGRCIDICPVNARAISGSEYDVSTLLQIVIADKPFYDNSGGGVTCSGGECMLQIDFLEEFLRRCGEAGVHTAVDTAGHVPWAYFERILPHTDLFLYDIKAIDGALHKKCTGADNKLILSNFEQLAGRCPEKLLARVPVIPGANESDMGAIAAYLDKHRIPRDLLPYHDMGESKRASLECRSVSSCHKEDSQK